MPVGLCRPAATWENAGVWKSKCFAVVTIQHLIAVAVPVVHTAAKTSVEHTTVAALASACPVALAEGFEALLPHLEKVVFVYVALPEGSAVDVGTGAYGTVDENRGDVDAGVAEIGVLAHLAFVAAQVALAAVGDSHRRDRVLTFVLDKLHQMNKLRIGEMQLGMVVGASDGDDGEYAPLFDSEADQQVVYFVKMRQVALADAGYDIEVEPAFGGGYGNGLACAFEAALAAAHPVVVGLEAVEADGHRAEACRHKPLVHSLVVEPSVGDDAPAHAAAAQGASHIGQVGPQQWFASGQDDGEAWHQCFLGYGVESAQEVLERHIGLAR